MDHTQIPQQEDLLKLHQSELKALALKHLGPGVKDRTTMVQALSKLRAQKRSLSPTGAAKVPKPAPGNASGAPARAAAGAPSAPQQRR